MPPEEVVELTPDDELTALKKRADLMQLSYHPSIGLEKLRAKVNKALNPEPEDEKEDEPIVEAAKPEKAAAATRGNLPPNPKESPGEKRRRIFMNATRLIRVRVMCMDPNKKDWDGEIITTGNKIVGTIKKFVPFNIDTGYHLPHMIYQQLLEKKCQIFVKSRAPDGKGMVSIPKLINAYAIEVLPPLTEKELKDLAQQQAMAHSID